MPVGVQFTEQGVEYHFAANYLGHFLLNKLLLNKLSPEARIINVTSGHYKKVGAPSPSPSTPRRPPRRPRWTR